MPKWLILFGWQEPPHWHITLRRELESFYKPLSQTISFKYCLLKIRLSNTHDDWRGSLPKWWTCLTLNRSKFMSTFLGQILRKNWEKLYRIASFSSHETSGHMIMLFAATLLLQLEKRFPQTCNMGILLLRIWITSCAALVWVGLGWQLWLSNVHFNANPFIFVDWV